MSETEIIYDTDWEALFEVDNLSPDKERTSYRIVKGLKTGLFDLICVRWNPRTNIEEISYIYSTDNLDAAKFKLQNKILNKN